VRDARFIVNPEHPSSQPRPVYHHHCTPPATEAVPKQPPPATRLP